MERIVGFKFLFLGNIYTVCVHMHGHMGIVALWSFTALEDAQNEYHIQNSYWYANQNGKVN